MANPENWLQWQNNLHNALQKDSTLTKISKYKKAFIIAAPVVHFQVDNSLGFVFGVNKTINDLTTNYAAIVVPNTINNSAVINIKTKRSAFRRIYLYFKQNNDTTDIGYLKHYMESPETYYGFRIVKTTVTDSNVVVIKKLVPLAKKQLTINQSITSLKKFLQKNQLKQVQPVIADIRAPEHDSVRIMIGLPINKTATSAGEVSFMHLPTHGHMLVGFYNGPYSGRKNLYAAMKQYVSDHHFSAPEDPYEKYLDNKIPATDTSTVRLQVNFPIF